MTSPDFGRITELKDDPVLSMPSIRPLSPSTRNAWPSGMLKKLMSLTQTQCGPAWVWVNDINFFSMPDGQAFLVDGDSGRMLGMLSTGSSFNSVILPKSGDVIYSPESYFSRGTRGTRTDVVTLYDTKRLQPLGEIV